MVAAAEAGDRFPVEQGPRWPSDQLLDLLADDALALNELLLLVGSRGWVHRRVESVSFPDSRTVARRVSVDFTVPENAPRLAVAGRSLSLLPIALMRRRTLVNFDLRNQSGGAMTLLSLRQNQVMHRAMLIAFAAHVLGAPPAPSIRRDLCLIAFGDKAEVEEAIQRFQPSQEQDDGQKHDGHKDVEEEAHQRSSLWGREDFRSLALTLQCNFIMFVLVDAPALSRTLIKYSYERSLSLYLARPRHAVVRTVAALAGVPLVLRMPTPMSEYCQSHHFEVSAPPRGRIGELHTGSKTGTARRDRDPTGRDDGLDIGEAGMRRVPLHEVDLPWGSNTHAEIVLLPGSSGWLPAALVTMWVNVLVLLTASARIGPLLAPTAPDPRPDAIVLFLVTLVAILLTMLMRPEEHGLVTRLLWPARRNTALCGALTLLAAYLIVFWPGEPFLPPTILALGFLALLLAALQTSVHVLSSGGSTRLSPWSSDYQALPDRNTGDHVRSGSDIPKPIDVAKRFAVDWVLRHSEPVSQATFFGQAAWNPELQRDLENTLRGSLGEVEQGFAHLRQCADSCPRAPLCGPRPTRDSLADAR